MNLEQQTAILDKTYRMLTEFVGKPPRGIVAPWWEQSKEGAELLLRYVFCLCLGGVIVLVLLSLALLLWLVACCLLLVTCMYG